ncbi:MAG: hypothetical protein J7513_17600 [Solirubrobacteraceae bacterium]|nr:hypothetical protein [Solirubrobacteraceae bacterium]
MTRPVDTPDEARVPRIVTGILGLIAVATVATGLTIHHQSGKLGTASPPFVMGWMPHVDALWLAAAILVAALVTFGAGRFLGAELDPRVVAGALFVAALALGLAVNAARAGTHAWWEPYDLQGGLARTNAINEYLPGLPTLDDGVRNYLDRFAEVVPSQSVNVAGHPPGPLVLAKALGATTAQGMAALVILLGACCAPLAHRLALQFSSGEREARLAGVLAACSPGLILIGVTSFDFAYAAFGALAALGLCARSRGGRILGGLAFAVASLMSWALLGVGAWAAIAVWRRDGWRAAFEVALIAGFGVAAVQGGLAAWAGYDPIGTLHATEQVYRDSLARLRPYAFWLFGSPVAWGLMAGPAIVAGAARGALRGWAPAVALVIIVAVAAIGGFTKAETERIWLFMVPLACVAAAPALARWRTAPLLGGLLAQALALSILMNTVW